MNVTRTEVVSITVAVLAVLAAVWQAWLMQRTLDNDLDAALVQQRLALCSEATLLMEDAMDGLEALDQIDPNDAEVRGDVLDALARGADSVWALRLLDDPAVIGPFYEALADEHTGAEDAFWTSVPAGTTMNTTRPAVIYDLAAGAGRVGAARRDLLTYCDGLKRA